MELDSIDYSIRKITVAYYDTIWGYYSTYLGTTVLVCLFNDRRPLPQDKIGYWGYHSAGQVFVNNVTFMCMRYISGVRKHYFFALHGALI